MYCLAKFTHSGRFFLSPLINVSSPVHESRAEQSRAESGAGRLQLHCRQSARVFSAHLEQPQRGQQRLQRPEDEPSSVPQLAVRLHPGAALGHQQGRLHRLQATAAGVTATTATATSSSACAAGNCAAAAGRRIQAPFAAAMATTAAAAAATAAAATASTATTATTATVPGPQLQQPPLCLSLRGWSHCCLGARSIRISISISIRWGGGSGGTPEG